MKGTETHLEYVDEVTDALPELYHTACCDDDDLMLCGAHVPGSFTPKAENEEDCRLCGEADGAMEADDWCSRCPLDLFGGTEGWSK